MINQKKYIKVIALLFGLIIITIILNSINSSMKQIQEIKPLEDENKLYQIQVIINNTYNQDYPEPSYITNKVIYSEDGLNSVYFVNGYLTKIKETGIEYNENVNYLIVSNGIYYEIDTIEEDNIDVFAKEYLDKYKVANLEIGQDNILPSANYDEKYKLTLYISNFTELLKVDAKKAYELLSKEEKKNYTSSEDLKNGFNLNLNTSIKDFKKKGKTYTITDYNDNTIIINENKLLDYTIEF